MAVLVGVPGVNVNATDASGNTALHLAVANGNCEVAKMLMSVPTVNLAVKNGSGKTAEQLARDGDLKTVLAQIPGTPEQMQAEIASLRESVRNIQMGMGGARI